MLTSKVQTNVQDLSESLTNVDEKEQLESRLV